MQRAVIGDSYWWSVWLRGELALRGLLYIAAGGGWNAVVADVIMGDVLKRLRGHRADVGCVKFVGGSKKIVSASEGRNGCGYGSGISQGHGVWFWRDTVTGSGVLP